MDRQQRAALDRHITGNYGANQFPPEEPDCDHLTRTFLGEDQGHPVYQCHGCGDLFHEPGRLGLYAIDLDVVAEEFVVGQAADYGLFLRRRRPSGYDHWPVYEFIGTRRSLLRFLDEVYQSPELIDHVRPVEVEAPRLFGGWT